MINPGNKIPIFFAKSLNSTLSIPRPALVLTSTTDNWNDFGNNFFVTLNIFAATAAEDFPLDMRLMFEGESRTHDYLEKLFKENGPIVELGKIKNRFCSILTEPDSYRKLVSSLGLDDAVMSLLRLGDAVAIESFHGDDSRRELTRSKSFHLGALRQGNAYFAWRRGRCFLRRNPPEPIADAASNFSVQVQLPGFKNAHEVNFNFQRDELIRNRIAVLIGRNGVGKTQLFLSMIKALVPSAPPDLTGQILAEAKFDPLPSFNSRTRSPGWEA